MMLAAVLLSAIAAQMAPLPAALPALVSGERPVLRAQAQVLVRIVAAAEVRGGRTDLPHQRRQGRAPEGFPLTLIEFE